MTTSTAAAEADPQALPPCGVNCEMLVIPRYLDNQAACRQPQIFSGTQPRNGRRVKSIRVLSHPAGTRAASSATGDSIPDLLFSTTQSSNHPTFAYNFVFNSRRPLRFHINPYPSADVRTIHASTKIAAQDTCII
jgi:hypothetical protein